MIVSRKAEVGDQVRSCNENGCVSGLLGEPEYMWCEFRYAHPEEQVEEK